MTSNRKPRRIVPFAILLAVLALTAVFLIRERQLRLADQRDALAIERIYRGPHGERVTRVQVIEHGRFDVARETIEGPELRFRVVRSGSNLMLADEESRRVAGGPRTFTKPDRPAAATE